MALSRFHTELQKCPICKHHVVWRRDDEAIKKHENRNHGGETLVWLPVERAWQAKPDWNDNGGARKHKFLNCHHEIWWCKECKYYYCPDDPNIDYEEKICNDCK